jgi:hypothetical protein
MNDLELKVLALGEAHRRIRDQGEDSLAFSSPEIVAELLVEMHKTASAVVDMIRKELGLCTDIERKLNRWIFPLALWEREREAREDAQRETKLQAMYSRPASTADLDMRDHMAARNQCAEPRDVENMPTPSISRENYDKLQAYAMDLQSQLYGV